MLDETTPTAQKTADESNDVISINEMRQRLMHVLTEFPDGDWKTADETLAFINEQLGTDSSEWFITIPNQLTKLIWDWRQVEGEYSMYDLWDLGYGRADAIRLEDGQWLVVYQNPLSKKFYCVIV
ncbi:hypothetical protein [Shimazuella kribbensis]|uniref:hypothetical protein n=1 Tax=Shimazuella kribbensis TaxID=139808 RepID=UPI00048F373D|nr:hypothetical protein [Shimazuella kribbensis]